MENNQTQQQSLAWQQAPAYPQFAKQAKTALILGIVSLFGSVLKE